MESNQDKAMVTKSIESKNKTTIRHKKTRSRKSDKFRRKARNSKTRAKEAGKARKAG